MIAGVSNIKQLDLRVKQVLVVVHNKVSMHALLLRIVSMHALLLRIYQKKSWHRNLRIYSQTRL